MDKTKLIAGILGITIVAGGTGYFLIRRHTSSVQNTQTANTSATGLLTGDTCTQFSKDFVASAIGEPVFRTQSYTYSTNHGCQYFVSETNKNQMVEIDVDTGSAADQKAANVYLGWKALKDDSIPMDNFLVWQDNNVLNKQYLVIDSNNFVMITRSGADVLTTDKMISFTAAVAKKLPKGGTAETAPSPTPTKTSTVPLPQETDIIRSFFNLIGEHRPADAVSMLAPDQVATDANKQAWAVQFNAFSTLAVTSVEPALQDSWTDTQHEYKVVLEASMKPESAKAPIPYYGWENGTNTRWITIARSGNLWKISGIGTGP